MNEPIQRAAAVYQSNGGNFNEDLAHCLAFGEVQSNHRFFCMGYPAGDDFYVKMLAGDFGECARHNISRFKTISFKRQFKGDGETRSCPIEKLARHGRHITMAFRN